VVRRRWIAPRDAQTSSNRRRAGHVHLAVDDRALALERIGAAELDQVQRGDDRRERVTELVAEHREELVLRARDGVGLRAGFGLGGELACIRERDADVDRERLEQRRGSRARAIGRLPVRTDRRERGFVGCAHRHHDRAPHERVAVEDGRHARVSLDIGNRGGGPVHDHPARDALLDREPLAPPQRRDRVLGDEVHERAVAEHEADAVRLGERARQLARELSHLLDAAHWSQLPRAS
jgi:hypothetical protein